MQTDAWLTDASHPDRCPLCSQPLAGGSNICPSCGFAAHEPVGKPATSLPCGQEEQRSSDVHNRNAEAASARPPVSRQSNPSTPIPARASAQRARSKPGVIPRRSHASTGATPSPAAQQGQKGAGWRHESPGYEAVSSLSALSLIISETPTAPPRPQRSTERLEHIDEIDTVPQPSGQVRAVQPSSAPVPAVSPDLPETLLQPGT